MAKRTAPPAIEDALRELAAAGSPSPGETPACAAARLGQALAEIAALGHRINNPLTAVIGRSQLLRMQEGADPRVLRSAELIAESAEHIAEGVRELTRLVHCAREALGELRVAGSDKALAADEARPSGPA